MLSASSKSCVNLHFSVGVPIYFQILYKYYKLNYLFIIKCMLLVGVSTMILIVWISHNRYNTYVLKESKLMI